MMSPVMKNGIISKLSGLYLEKEGSLINLKQKPMLFQRNGIQLKTNFADVQQATSKKNKLLARLLTYSFMDDNQFEHNQNAIVPTKYICSNTSETN